MSPEQDIGMANNRKFMDKNLKCHLTLRASVALPETEDNEKKPAAERAFLLSGREGRKFRGPGCVLAAFTGPVSGKAAGPLFLRSFHAASLHFINFTNFITPLYVHQRRTQSIFEQ